MAESIHVSDEDGDEDAAKQRGGGGREHHHDHAARHVDQGAQPRPHDDLSQLDHAGERGAVHPTAPLARAAASLLQLLLGGKSRKREREREERWRKKRRKSRSRRRRRRIGTITGDVPDRKQSTFGKQMQTHSG